MFQTSADISWDIQRNTKCSLQNITTKWYRALNLRQQWHWVYV